jgi:glutaredoxin
MAFAFLNRWFDRTPAQRRHLHILLYTRAGCHLCDEAWELLLRHQKRHGFALETKDVDESAELVQAYGQCVPVVLIAGQVRFRGHVNEVLLRRLLEAKA